MIDMCYVESSTARLFFSVLQCVVEVLDDDFSLSSNISTTHQGTLKTNLSAHTRS